MSNKLLWIAYRKHLSRCNHFNCLLTKNKKIIEDWCRNHAMMISIDYVISKRRRFFGIKKIKLAKTRWLFCYQLDSSYIQLSTAEVFTSVNKCSSYKFSFFVLLIKSGLIIAENKTVFSIVKQMHQRLLIKAKKCLSYFETLSLL